MFSVVFLLLISTNSVLLIEEDIQLEKKSETTKEALLAVYNTNISFSEIQKIQDIARKNLTLSSGRGARTLDFLGDVWVGLQCLTFHCLADVTKAGYCCIKSLNVHCCVIYRNHYESIVPSTSQPFIPPEPCQSAYVIKSSYSSFQDYFNNHGDDDCYHNNGFTTSRPWFHTSRPSYHEETVTYYPIIKPGTRPPNYVEDNVSPIGHTVADWNTKTKAGECPTEILAEHTGRRKGRLIKRVKKIKHSISKRQTNRNYRKWNLDLTGPGRDYRNSRKEYRECSNDFDCLGRKKCCYSRLSYTDFNKICRYPVIDGHHVGRIR